jgi:hypothetical protein
MKKRLLLLAGFMLALGTIVSADQPLPPCDPDCGTKPPAAVADQFVK